MNLVKNKDAIKNISSTPILSKSTANFITRFTFGSLFFILGFNFSNSVFFNENPLFGVRFLAELLISSAAWLFGFSVLPLMFKRAQNRIEELIQKTVEKIVSDFWQRQSKNMEEARRQKQLKQKEEQDKKNKEQMQHNILVDTSVLIDGRVIGIAKSGFLFDNLVIPSFVLNELHSISDSSDTIKRKKGRRGLDAVKELRKLNKAILAEDFNDSSDVDKDLVKLAKKFKMRLMTVDFNLIKVAQASGVSTLNINDLVEAVKFQFVPGEILRIKIVHLGKSKGQGVGYLDDGTMIVVDKAGDKIGETLNVKVSRVIQSSAGKMVFSEIFVEDFQAKDK